MKYDIKQIELAFFNHDSDGSDSSDDEAWQKRRKEWATFKHFLMEDHQEVRAETPNFKEERGIIGLSESDAKKKVEDEGKVFRVTCRESKPLVCTMDWNPDRINVSVDDGIVVYRGKNG